MLVRAKAGLTCPSRASQTHTFSVCKLHVCLAVSSQHRQLKVMDCCAPSQLRVAEGSTGWQHSCEAAQGGPQAHSKVPDVTFCDGSICCCVCQAPQGVALVAAQGSAVLGRQHWLGGPRPKVCTGNRPVHLHWGTGSLENSPLQQLPVWLQQPHVRQGMGCTTGNDLTELRFTTLQGGTTAGALTGSQKASVLALAGSRRVGEQQCPLHGVPGQAACSGHPPLKHNLNYQIREGLAGTFCTLLYSSHSTGRSTSVKTGPSAARQAQGSNKQPGCIIRTVSPPASC